MTFGLGITVILFSLFVIFQIIYIIVPLIALKSGDITTADMAKDGINEDNIKKEEITILVPAYNEENVIHSCIKEILKLDYGHYNVIIINDGSRDQTMELLKTYLQLTPAKRDKTHKLKHRPVIEFYQSSCCPHIFVIDKFNGGKADALNCGIEYSSSEIIVTLDADSILHHNALGIINSSMSDGQVVAAGGVVHIYQGIDRRGHNYIPSFKLASLLKYQIIQYLVNFYLYKVTHSRLGAMTVISGAFGVFRRSILLEVNGYRCTVGEDMDITLKIQSLIRTKLKGKKMILIPQALCFTECPQKITDLFLQRFRWQRGFIDCVAVYGGFFVRKFYSSISLYFLLDSFVLGTLSAFTVLAIFILMLFLKSGYSLFLILLSISFLIGIIQGIVSLIVSNRFGYRYSKSDYLRALFYIPLDLLSYRLLGLIFNTVGTILYFIDKKNWHKTSRIRRNPELFVDALAEHSHL